MIIFYVPDGKDTNDALEAVNFAANSIFKMYHESLEKEKALKQELNALTEQFLRLQGRMLKIKDLAEARRELNCSMEPPPEDEPNRYGRYERAHDRYIEALNAVEDDEDE